MDFKESYKRWAYSLFSQYITPYLDNFEGLRDDLKKSGMDYNLKEYLSISLLTIVIIFALEFPTMSFITGLIPAFTPLMAVMFSFTISIGLCLIFFFFFYIYPSNKASSRKKELDYVLPFATIYLATMSSGSPPISMFKVLGKFEEFGEINKEAKRIVRDVELFGMNIRDALQKVASRSPSESFKDLLWGINSIIASGGDLTKFLHEKSSAYMEDYRRKLNEYSNSLSTIIEIYLTLVIVGSIFFVVMTSIMGLFGMSGLSEVIVILHFVVTFLGLPLISIGFIYLIKSISPGG